TLGDINIALSPTRVARISGRAVSSEGKPVSNGMLILAQAAGSMAISSIGAPLKPDGTFSLGGVAPGDYILRVLVAAGGPGALTTPELVQANVTVAGEDINDLSLVGVKPSTLSGRVVMPGSETDQAKFSELMLLAIPKTPMPLGGN